MLGWKLGLKGITVYVDGSRSGVLLKSDDKIKKFVSRDAIKRPKQLPCNIHRATIRNEKWIVIVGLFDEKPYEIFCGLSDKIELPKKYETGMIIKNSRKTTRSIYDLSLGYDDEELYIKDIVGIFNNANNASLTRFISLALRHRNRYKICCRTIIKR